jgi:hypothetical protein
MKRGEGKENLKMEKMEMGREMGREVEWSNPVSAKFGDTASARKVRPSRDSN